MQMNACVSFFLLWICNIVHFHLSLCIHLIVNVHLMCVSFGFVLFVSAHYDEIFYICLFFGIAVLILLSSIMFVFGRIILHKRNASAMNSGAASVSELSTTVDAMTKLQSSDTIGVTTMANDNDTANGKNSTTITSSTDECTENAPNIDLTAPMSIPSISSRNNVSVFTFAKYLPNFAMFSPNIRFCIFHFCVCSNNNICTIHTRLVHMVI